jgi:predicted NAD-dependent protein-ADP-ribosyltransferase YbiA (DUF1768 family)
MQDMYAQKMKHWGKKGPGIAAKMVMNLKPALAKEAFGLHLKARGAKRKVYWKCLLKAKFQQNEDARKTLLSTAPNTLVEQARYPGKNNYWDAFITKDRKSLIGRNVMGRLVQYMRDYGLNDE